MGQSHSRPSKGMNVPVGPRRVESSAGRPQLHFPGVVCPWECPRLSSESPLSDIKSGIEGTKIRKTWSLPEHRSGMEDW